MMMSAKMNFPQTLKHCSEIPPVKHKRVLTIQMDSEACDLEKSELA